jgi:hypothetical protein
MHMRRPQCVHEVHERVYLGWTQVLSVCGHIAPALNHLANQLIVCHSGSDIVQRRTALSAVPAEAMAIPALLVL